MGSRSDYRLRPKSSGGMSCGVELRISGKCWICARITIGRKHAGQMNSSSAHVGDIEFYRAKIMIHPGGVSANVTVTKIACDHPGGNQLDLIARRERVEITLKSLPVDRRVCRDFG